MSKSRVTWANSVPILVFLDLSVLDLHPMYSMTSNSALVTLQQYFISNPFSVIKICHLAIPTALPQPRPNLKSLILIFYWPCNLHLCAFNIIDYKLLSNAPQIRTQQRDVPFCDSQLRKFLKHGATPFCRRSSADADKPM